MAWRVPPQHVPPRVIEWLYCDATLRAVHNNPVTEAAGRDLIRSRPSLAKAPRHVATQRLGRRGLPVARVLPRARQTNAGASSRGASVAPARPRSGRRRPVGRVPLLVD